MSTYWVVKRELRGRDHNNNNISYGEGVGGKTNDNISYGSEVGGKTSMII